MSTATNNPGPQSEDIDLLLLIERSILFFRKYKWIFFIAVILGISSGLIIYRQLPTVYKSRLIVHSYMLTNQEQIGIADNWSDLLKRKEYAALTKIFNCTENTLVRLKEIDAGEIQKMFSATNPNGFFIDVIVTDNVILDDLEKGIVYGFENNPYIKERLNIHKANIREMIDKTTTEIQKLDSTKKILENIMVGTGRSSTSIITDGSGVNRLLIEMNEKLLSLKEELQFAKAVQVLQDFSKFRKPAGPKLFVWVALGLIVFLPLAWVYALYNSVSEKLRTRSRLRKNHLIKKIPSKQDM